MLVILGESASGKSTVQDILCEKYGFKKLITYTTREPRKGEINGRDYHFVSIERFKELLNSGFFCESATYNGWDYGTATEDCTNDKVAVLTPHGFRQIKKLVNVTSFYINVSRRDRLVKILNRGDNIEEAYRRSLSDVGMFDGIVDEVDFAINNDEYSKSPIKVAEIIAKNYMYNRTEE